MKRTTLIYKGLCFAAAVAIFTVPLLACGDDNKLCGECVTSNQWQAGIEALNQCENYTETVEMKQTRKTGDTSVSYTYKNVYKFDINNHVIFASQDYRRESTATYYNTTSNTVEYLFLCPVENEERSWIIGISNGYYDENNDFIYDDQWHIRRAKLNNFEKYDVAKSWGWSVEQFYGKDNKDYSIQQHYSDAIFNESDGSYKYVYENTKTEYATAKCYFADKILKEIIIEGKATTANYTTTTYMKGTCSNFGKTYINVPSEVKEVLDEYKATHDPYEYDYE